jgi:hydroxyethylthiazole kinase
MFVRELDPALKAIESLRKHGVVVHCITNTVAQNFTANILLACGAKPSMTASPEEVPYFSERCDGLLVNLGTLDMPRREAIVAAMEVCTRKNVPMVFDPVKCDLSPPRLEFSRQLLTRFQPLLKANIAEAEALGDIPVACRVTTGKIDRIEAGDEKIAIANGDPLLGRIIATGCALGGLVAALGAVAENQRVGALAALVWFGVAAEIAAPKARGPASFKSLFIDALAGVDTATLRAKANIS